MNIKNFFSKFQNGVCKIDIDVCFMSTVTVPKRI